MSSLERTAFMFAGQGAQFPGMGAALAEDSPTARNIFSRADQILGYSISNLCFHGTLEDLTPCRVCQPAIFTVSIAMLEAYREKHPALAPHICGGLSLGEFSAACEAGIFGFDDALRLVAERGRLMDQCCQEYPGGMAAILGSDPPEQIQEICRQCGIDVANYNCPGQIVISGEINGLEKAMAQLEAAGNRVIRLTVAGAYHSRLMQSAADAFGKVLEHYELHAPNCIFLQNVVGTPVASPQEIRANLQSQIASSVRWEECASFITQNADTALEFGPGNVLSKFMKRISRRFTVSAPFAEEQ